MNNNSNNNLQLERITKLENEIKSLQQILQQKQNELQQLKNNQENPYNDNKFTSIEITKYSRQIIIPKFGVSKQQALKKGNILIVGVGGLGCPAALYLAACGIGAITLIDYDDVELTNLHRQILHYEYDVGLTKVQSAYNTLKGVNGNVKVIPIKTHLNRSNISKIIANGNFDIVLDCTDNVATRYLLNDICVIYKLPLISGSALQYEGQLTVYNYKNEGPCYRCLFPKPPPSDTVTNCGDGGVLGVIPGVIGILQALEVIKILTKSDGILSEYLLIFDGENTTFRKLKLRKKNPKCDVCGDLPTITSPIDYEEFCGAKAHDKVENINLLQLDDNIKVDQLKNLLNNEIIIDVRPLNEYEMCKLPNTLNIPYNDLLKDKNKLWNVVDLSKTEKVYFLCRRGNDSQRTIKYLKGQFPTSPVKFINIEGGLYAFNKFVDPLFPLY